MTTVNMLEAKSQLSRLVEAVESGAEPEIVIARNGKPAARLVPIESPRKGQRIGVAAGKYVIPDDIDVDNKLVAQMFAASEIEPE